MENAVWLFFATPLWFLAMVLTPFSAGPLSAVPALGVWCLLIGALLTLFAWSRGPLLFALPVALSQIFVAGSGLMRGTIEEPGYIVLTFLLAQLAIAGGLLFLLRRTFLAALSLAVFSLSYAGWTAFIASMSFRDVWV